MLSQSICSEININSLYIILVSQFASLLLSLVSGNIPQEFYATNNSTIWILLFGMVICGIGGGIIGKQINKKISNHTVDKLFVILIYVILALSVYNTLTKFQII